MRLEQQVTICNKLGLHARAATKLAILANEFEATITVSNGEKTVNANSVLGLLMLGSGLGKSITLITEGKDAEPAMKAISHLINAGFDENQ